MYIYWINRKDRKVGKIVKVKDEYYISKGTSGYTFDVKGAILKVLDDSIGVVSVLAGDIVEINEYLMNESKIESCLCNGNKSLWSYRKESLLKLKKVKRRAEENEIVLVTKKVDNGKILTCVNETGKFIDKNSGNFYVLHQTQYVVLEKEDQKNPKFNVGDIVKGYVNDKFYDEIEILENDLEKYGVVKSLKYFVGIKGFNGHSGHDDRLERIAIKKGYKDQCYFVVSDGFELSEKKVKSNNIITVEKKGNEVIAVLNDESGSKEISLEMKDADDLELIVKIAVKRLFEKETMPELSEKEISWLEFAKKIGYNYIARFNITECLCLFKTLRGFKRESWFADETDERLNLDDTTFKSIKNDFAYTIDELLEGNKND